MAPLKRVRRVIDDGDSDGEDAENAAPSVREATAKRKRARISQPGASSHLRTTRARRDDDSDRQPDEMGEGNSGGDEMDYERRRDAGFEDLEDEDLDTQRATQIIRKRNEKTMENLPAENGIIESVTCINFMCHNKFHISLGPLINFIIGFNGSGKSAILTAITLCLGGKANSTNRGGSLKAFVKEGRESATLIVKLKNGGYGYQQEIYGDSIIVERHFTKTGSSGFKLKSATGRVISTKKADLEEICDYFALQIDNPMNVLTQDMSRQFLNNSTPADKYRFFVKGVQLEQLDQDYQLLEETIDLIESRLKIRDDDIHVLENRAKKAMAKLEMSDKHDKLRERIRNYMRQMAWSQVEQEENKLATFDVELQEAISSIEEAERKAGTVDQVFDEANQAHERGAESLREVGESISPIQEKKRQAKERFDSNKGELMQLHLEQRTIRDHLKNADKRIENYKADITIENQRLEDANDGNHVRRVAEIERAKREVIDVRHEYDQHSSRTACIEEDVRAAEQELSRASYPIEAKRAEIKACESVIDSLLRDRGQHLSAFHPNMPKLLQAIRSERRFREKPVGPVGNHIKLLKPVWSSILERSFGATLTSFIVTSKSDQDILAQLMKKESCSCPILIGNNQPINTSNSEPDPQYDTSLRVLEIDNDIVRRQLIINQAIEQTLLIENRHEAQRAMYGGSRPRNVKQCFCFNENRKGWGIRFGFRGSDESSAPMQPMDAKPRMKTDVETQINYQREILRDLQRELNDLERHSGELRNRLRARKQALQTHQKQHKDLHVKIQRAEETAERLQDELERDTVQDGRLQALEGLLREAEEDKSIIEGSYEEAVTQKDKLNAVAKELSKELKAVDSELAEIEAKIRKKEAKALELSQARQVALLEKNSAFQKIDDAKLERTRAESKREAQSKRVREFIEQARKVSERVPIDPGETPGSLDKKLEKLTNDLNRFNREIGGSPEQIAQEAQEAAEAYRMAKEQLEQLDEMGQMLKFALIERQNRWRKFRKFISARARAQFTYLLSERSFRGALKTDHRRHTLDLQVEPDETRSGKGRQTKTLSGGEKSFSTICLLLSLWEAMGSPIRCLDEFDVFMDNVNRDINAARRSVGRQFVLITPNSLGNINMAEDVRIIKLNDPKEKGQTTLSFASQGGS
ncbi:MAG: Structural maintenance of chromosomes protein 6 [Geoglossum umbratile]|nr:MAG: Structural maintenance of chromosomes protein 6 [Geoglossum umbratile]